jgi:predicted enzyme related to lactoylglutathione lyase
VPHPVVHFEIHAPDAAAAQEFYRQLFGWHVDTDNPMSYGMVDTHSDGKGIGGGITANPMNAAMVTVYVDDLQATLDKAEKLGGKTIMPPTQVYEGLMIALFTDPAGNTIGLAKGM